MRKGAVAYFGNSPPFFSFIRAAVQIFETATDCILL